MLSAPGLDGLSLHGDEATQHTDAFVDAFAEARRRGLQTKAHAGELMGAASVATALDLLGVTPIEHGVRAAEDDALVERLAAEAVTLDVCPWSNVRLKVVRDLARHPIRRLHERGVRLTINTDDPTVFGRTLSEELASLVDDLGFHARRPRSFPGQRVRGGGDPGRHAGRAPRRAQRAARSLSGCRVLHARIGAAWCG